MFSATLFDQPEKDIMLWCRNSRLRGIFSGGTADGKSYRFRDRINRSRTRRAFHTFAACRCRLIENSSRLQLGRGFKGQKGRPEFRFGEGRCRPLSVEVIRLGVLGPFMIARYELVLHTYLFLKAPMRRQPLPTPAGNTSRPRSLRCPRSLRWVVIYIGIAIAWSLSVSIAEAQKPANQNSGKRALSAVKDAKNTSTGKADLPHDPQFAKFGIYEKTAPRAESIQPIATKLPLEINPGDRIAMIGNSLFERSQHFGNLEAMIQQSFPDHHLTVRHLAWSADQVNFQPRPDNFADTMQHLTHEKVDVIFAAYGFNESFAGEAGIENFREQLITFLEELKTKAFNDESAPRIVLVSPIANENLPSVAAADFNNDTIEKYAGVMREVAAEQNVGFADVFGKTRERFQSLGSDHTINGIHLNDEGDRIFSGVLFKEVFGRQAPDVIPELADVISNKNRQYFRRFRPLNTFYYTGGRSKTYGYLDFLPAMRNFDQMTANRDRRIWDLAQGKLVTGPVDDSNLPPMPETKQSRGANEWLTAAEEQAAFKMDPRFEVNLFAGEEQFPEIANPIQMRWDSRKSVV